MKGNSAKAANWTVRNQEFMASEVWLEIKDWIPSSMKNELEDYPEDYLSLTYEDCCELLSTIEVKEERKRAASHIKKISSDSEAYIYGSNESARIPSKKKARTGALHSNKPHKKAHKHHSIHWYCMLC